MATLASHPIDIPNMHDHTWTSWYACKHRWTSSNFLGWLQMTSNDFILHQIHSAAIIIVSEMLAIPTQVFVTHDKLTKCRIRMQYTILNSIRHFFNIYMTCGTLIQVLLDTFMTSVSFSTIVHYSLGDIGIYPSPFTLPHVFPCSISFLVLLPQNLYKLVLDTYEE